VTVENTNGQRVVDLLVVGGGPAGLAAVRGYRAAGGAGEVALLSADPHPPYARPPLTKEYLRGEVDAAELPLAPDHWYLEQQVDLRLGDPVTQLWPDRRAVATSAGEVLGYRALVLATGSAPKPLPVTGGDHPALVHVRDRLSGDALRAIADRGGSVIVIGSGFIGCEAAAGFAHRGLSVLLVTDEELPHARRLGPEAGSRVAEWLRTDGVELVLGDQVAAVAPIDAGGWRVELGSGRVRTADAVVVGGGAAPNVALAEAAGLRMDGGGVAADAELRTSDAAIWAAGDIVCAHNGAAGRGLRVEHWGEAEAMGEIAGANAAGRRRRWEQAPGFWSAIGDHVLKYTAWGDGYDASVLEERGEGWAVWYAQDSVLVGVLSSDWDEAYERGRELIERGAGIAEATTEVPR
jgi:3-phenylpropionate/trans-cinnamate dioxygenase ferredoxin reductase component